MVFSNDDILLEDEADFDTYLKNAMRPDVGVCGHTLHYPNGNLQHAGIVLGYGGFADHVYRGSSGEHPYAFVGPYITRTVSAVTGALHAIRKEVFEAHVGYDEAMEVIGSDVAFCLRTQETGLRTLYVAGKGIVHRESITRKHVKPPAKDLELFSQVLAGYLPDQYFNQSIDLRSRIPIPRLTSP